MSTEEKAVVEQGVHTYTGKEGYVPPEDPAVREKLRWFQDRKLGLMIHWGLYCQMGMVASWGLSDEDQEWSRRQVNWTQDPGEFKRQYRNLNRSFYPVRFQPQEWAGMAADCGFQYLLLTTKHHDGFCLWDTQWTDYKVTGPDCPYRVERYADLVGAMFQAFREKGLGIGAYFSKADWHTPLYRGPEDDGAFTHRGPAYDPAQEPERWQKFVEFTQGQVLELCANYGPVDILWLDAGWVCPENGQDLHIGELAAKARALQPGLLVVDRTAGGPYENYVTPEMLVPPEPLGIPWESCLTLGTDFDYKFGDRYKTPRELVGTLVGIVAKGGNLALNVSPQPDGRVPVEAWDSLRGLGQWLKTYGEAIYGTRVCPPYQAGPVAFTRKGSAVYALRTYESPVEPVEPELLLAYPGEVRKITLVDTGEEVAFVREAGGLKVRVPEARRAGSAPLALVFRLETGEEEQG